MSRYVTILATDEAEWLRDHLPLNENPDFRFDIKPHAGSQYESLVTFNEPLLRHLQALPPDEDGHADKHDDNRLWIMGYGYPVSHSR